MTQPNAAKREAIRPLFTRLYETQSLRDVKKQLEDEGFHATIRMYKTKIKRWRLDKNRKYSDALHVVRKAKNNHGRGRSFSYRVRGKAITIQNVLDYLARKGVEGDAVDALHLPSSPTPSVISCCTLRSSTPLEDRADLGANSITSLCEALGIERSVYHIPNSVEASSYHSMEIPPALSPSQWERSSVNCVRSIRYYYGTMLHSPKWIAGATNSNVSAIYPSITFGSLFLKYHDLRMLRRGQQALHALRDAFNMIDYLLIVQDPRLLIYFLESVAFLRAEDYHGLARSLMGTFAGKAREQLGVVHPITIFATCLVGWTEGALNRLVEIGLCCMMEEFYTELNGDHIESMRLMLTASMILRHQRDFGTAYRTLQKLSDQYRRKYGTYSYESCHALVDMAYIRLAQSNHGHAGVLLEKAMRLPDGIVDATEAIESRVRCLMFLAQLREGQGQNTETTEVLRSAIQLGTNRLGSNHWMMRHVTALLEKC